ncbi:MAG TPA: MFS transporter, partial [Paracoccaceae bacterium]|nr:MFS transporter [Paracoccaceae bacterium]
MSRITARRRVWGWMFFDWASQPYHTLLLTFIFAPYMRDLLGDGSQAQAVWGFGLAAGGLVIAVLGPVVGAIADQTGSRMRWIWISSLLYVVGASVLWWAEPGHVNLYFVLTFFAIGVVGVDMATIFTNSMLPDLGPRKEIGRISGTGWALGYIGGLISLLIMLAFFAEDARTGTTILGNEPAFGLDPDTREGTRFVGPFTALWYIVFMIPFFLWVRDPKPVPRPGAAREALRQLWTTLKSLPSRKSLFAYLGASMLYRDALNGIYAFGGLYAAGVLGWEIVDVGQFGILAIVTGAVFAWVGGKADDAFGPKPVIVVTLTV